MIAGMWFRICSTTISAARDVIIPIRTQQGDILLRVQQGIGWRKIIENMYKNATSRQWYKEHGKHDIYAKAGCEPRYPPTTFAVIDAARRGARSQLDHDVPITAAEENRARSPLKFLKEEARVRKISRNCPEAGEPEVVQIGSLTDIKRALQHVR